MLNLRFMAEAMVAVPRSSSIIVSRVASDLDLIGELLSWVVFSATLSILNTYYVLRILI